ncbi:hypothetical protein SFHH103_03375 [Sinorhizobium fredii HH103]|uniref:Uncharacterized protein n=1 Tax=Sinorhizobium fredii (strain HH103) TaxID=1117943 RepID=G9A3B9_SINF1|nr:hypothetical protein [Sinorhizobium fredii]CCE97867.1 hypothetical protein SFHH103_03375 [Sinorhizobium fredii HH103]
MRYQLDAREYKLLLDPERFRNIPAETGAGILWEQQLKPIIEARLDLRNGGEPRYEGKLKKRTERTVRYWDTRDCVLTRADLTLRERLPVDCEVNSDAPPEITLKLRMGDLFVVAQTELPSSHGARPTFEEDIAPHEVDDPKPGKQSVIVPAKRAIRSRFARSTTQTTDWSPTQRTLGSLSMLYPSIHEIVEAQGAPFIPNNPLVSGPEISELVYKGAQVRLGAGVIGKFALTLWYVRSEFSAPTVAEISFKCDTIDGDMPGGAARRALALFLGMQIDLGGWVNSKHSSKTALALPGECGTSVE